MELGMRQRRLATLAAFGLWASPAAAGSCFNSPVPNLLPLESVRICLKSTTVSPQTVYHTVTHLEHGVGTLYSFRDIAEDARKSEADAGSCALAVHDVQLDIEGMIAKLKSDMMAAFKVDDFEKLLDVSSLKGTDAFEFHERIAKGFILLNDAHTRYVPPHWSKFPYFKYVTAADQDIDLRLEAPATDDGLTKPSVYMRVAAGPYEASNVFEKVRRIDNSEPWEWLASQARSGVGFYKSWGGRINSYLNKWFSHTFDNMPLPEKESFSILFEDGTEMPVTVKVATLPGQSYALASIQAAMDSNSKWKSLRSWLATDLQLQGPARLQALRAIAEEYVQQTQELRAPELRVLPPAAPEPAVEFMAPNEEELRSAESRRLYENVQPLGEWPSIKLTLTNGKTLAPMFAAYWMPDKKLAVLKISTFMAYSLLPGADMVPQLSMENMFQGLWTLHKRLADKAGNDGRLLLDLSDNGGGMVELANIVIQMVSPRLDSKSTLCSRYAVMMDEFWQDWLASFGGKLTEVQSYIRSRMTEEEVTELMDRLDGLSSLQTILEVPAPIDWSLLDRLQLRIDTATTLDEKRELLAGAVGNTGEFAGLLKNTLRGADSSDGWFPFTGDVEDPASGEAFPQPLEPYRRPEAHRWGKDEANYTMKYLFACDLPFKFGCWDQWKHQWKQLGVLTNGLCGSACSLVASKLQFAAGATTFSYGGHPGIPMDTSAFAGGNVENWDAFSDQVLYAGVVGDMMHGPNTPIGRRLRDPAAKHRHYAHTLTLPLPSAAKATFNFNMMFLSELGDNALPREWYEMPAHRHYWDTWLHTSDSDQSLWDNLRPIYGRIGGEDFEALRKAGGFNGREPGLYRCAAEPPTAPWKPACQVTTSRAAQLIVWVFTIVSLCCCFGCCGGAAWIILKGHKQRQQPPRSQDLGQAEGQERTLVAHPTTASDSRATVVAEVGVEMGTTIVH